MVVDWPEMDKAEVNYYRAQAAALIGVTDTTIGSLVSEQEGALRALRHGIADNPPEETYHELWGAVSDITERLVDEARRRAGLAPIPDVSESPSD